MVHPEGSKIGSPAPVAIPYYCACFCLSIMDLRRNMLMVIRLPVLTAAGPFGLELFSANAGMLVSPCRQPLLQYHSKEFSKHRINCDASVVAHMRHVARRIRHSASGLHTGLQEISWQACSQNSSTGSSSAAQQFCDHLRYYAINARALATLQGLDACMRLISCHIHVQALNSQRAGSRHT